MTCTFCGSDEGVSYYRIKKRGFLAFPIQACVSCAEIQRQKKDVLEVERFQPREAS